MKLKVNTLGYFLHGIDTKATMTVEELWQLVCQVEDAHPAYPEMGASEIAEAVNSLVVAKD